MALSPTPHQVDILRVYMESGNTREAATKLGLSEQTVKNQLAELRKRVGVRYTHEAIAKLLAGEL